MSFAQSNGLGTSFMAPDIFLFASCSVGLLYLLLFSLLLLPLLDMFFFLVYVVDTPTYCWPMPAILLCHVCL